MGPVSYGSSHSRAGFALVPHTQRCVWKQQARCCRQSGFGWEGPLLRHGKAFGSWAQLPAARPQRGACGCLQHRANLGARDRDDFKESRGCRSPRASAGLAKPCVQPARSSRDQAAWRQPAGEQRGAQRAARLSPERLR